MEKTKKARMAAGLISVAFISLLLGLAFNIYFALGYLCSIFIHELGQYSTARLLRIEISFGSITPLGGAIVTEDIEEIEEKVFVVMAGPVLGVLFAMICYLAYYFTGSSSFLAASYIAVLFNLLNLIPAYSFDGGRIDKIALPVLSYIVIAILSYLVLEAQFKALLIIFLIIAIIQAYNTGKTYYSDNYLSLDRRVKIKYTAFYSILVILLGLSAFYFAGMII